jgi:hypothetical protein
MLKGKYNPRYFKPEFLNFKNHWAIGSEYTVKGSRGDDYTIEFTDKGFTCNCIGMTMHGKCKHTQAIAERWQYACSDDFIGYAA